MKTRAGLAALAAIIWLGILAYCVSAHGQDYEVPFSPPAAEAPPSDITFIDGTSASATATSISVNAPTGMSSGHFILAGVQGDAASQTIEASDGETWTTLSTSNNNSSTYSIFYKFHDGSEPATYAFHRADSGSDNFTMTVVAFSGVDATYPVQRRATTTNVTGTSTSIAAFDTTVANMMLVSTLGIGSTQTVTGTPTSFTLAEEIDGVAPGQSVYYKAQPTADTTGTADWTVSGSVQLKGRLFSLRKAFTDPTVGGPSFVTAAVNTDNAGSAITWANPTNVFSSNNSRATATLNGTNVSDYLDATALGFSIGAATVDGVEVTVERIRNGGTTGDCFDSSVELLDSTGSVVGVSRAFTTTAWPTTEASVVYGDVDDKWGAGAALDATDINSANFGVRIAVVGDASANRVCNIDGVQVTVYYH